MSEHTRESVIELAKKVAKECNTPVSRREFEQRARISTYTIYRLFPDGGWNRLRELAGIPRHPLDNEPLSDTEILEAFHSLATELGTIPTGAQIDALAKVSRSSIYRRFGGQKGLLTQYGDWLKEHNENSPLCGVVEEKLAKSSVSQTAEALSGLSTGIKKWEKLGRTEYGAPINFRGLRHAPTNEQGVVYLFGIVSYDLGIIVESVQASFPDCEAKRCIDPKGNRWERVLIEFEYRSSNFRDHGHDPGKCDLIVCWEHDWSECPVKVIELRKVIQELGD